jgi:hypothetical protein
MRPVNKFRGNIFVANLPNGYTDEQLAQLFDPYGIVLGAFLARDPVTRKTRGFGLVNIAPEKATAKAIAALNGTQVDGRKIEARAADPEMSINLPTPVGGGHSSHQHSGHAPAMAPRFAPAAVRTAPRRPVQVEYRSIARRP